MTSTFGLDAHRPVSMATADFGPDGATGTFGDTPVRPERSAPTELGTTIAGRYTLLEVIGEGGIANQLSSGDVPEGELRFTTI